jgi:diguanylate cyclase (GGDEF)-like protein
MKVTARRTLAHEVTDAFRIVIASAVAMVVVLAVVLMWFSFAGDPAIDRAADVVSHSRAVQSGLLNEQSILRAYVLTGDPAVLQPLAGAEAGLTRTRTQLAAAAPDGHSLALVKSLDNSVQAWQRGWVAQALDPASRALFVSADGSVNAAKLAVFVSRGERSFDTAQTAAARVLAQGQRAQAATRRVTAIAVAGAAGLQLMIGIAATVATVRRRRLLDRRVVGPVGVLLAKVQAAGRGEFGASPIIDAPVELLELRDELANMSASLVLQQQALATRAENAAASARRLQLVVSFAREISDSLTLSNVLSAVTAAGRRLVESPRARVWLLEDDGQTLRLHHDSITGDVVKDAIHEVGVGGLGRAAADRRLAYSVGLGGDNSEVAMKPLVAEMPLVKGARLIGILEIVLPADAAWLDDDTVEVLQATAAQAAIAIDAAMLYALSESLSRSDPLTGLANRRQLDQDLELEVERAGRYQRPMTFFMIDIDHFKTVNDTFGHALGDTVLQQVAELLRQHMRPGDTVYRYGGEEFAVLARETDLADGHAVAERLRHAIATHYGENAPEEISVTISVGLALLSKDAESAADVIDAADRALYAAKDAGRNRVRVATDGHSQAPARVRPPAQPGSPDAMVYAVS